jgi:hypothetical protein
MADTDLSQNEANALLALEKVRENDTIHLFPVGGSGLIVPLIAVDRSENFLLDLSRGRINLLKAKYQTRARQVVVLARLDLNGAPHRNPDDVEVPCPHLHLYRAGYGHKWAVPAPTNDFPHLGDLWATLFDFMAFCNITRPPHFEKGLLV